MVGAGSHIKQRDRGYRNHFASGTTGPDYESMQRLLGFGLVVAGRVVESMQYFYATEEGCKLAGLTPAQTKRALSPN